MLHRGMMAAALLGLLQACAVTAPKVDGPSATVMDTASGGGMGGGIFFVLTEYDGQP